VKSEGGRGGGGASEEKEKGKENKEGLIVDG